MAYDALLIRPRVCDLLASQPRARLAEIARALGMDRHTVEGALARCGTSFRALQHEATLRAIVRLLDADQPHSQKTAAAALGFSSPGALSHFLRRHSAEIEAMRLECPLLRPNVSLQSLNSD